MATVIAMDTLHHAHLLHPHNTDPQLMATAMVMEMDIHQLVHQPPQANMDPHQMEMAMDHVHQPHQISTDPQAMAMEMVSQLLVHQLHQVNMDHLPMEMAMATVMDILLLVHQPHPHNTDPQQMVMEMEMAMDTHQLVLRPHQVSRVSNRLCIH